MPIYLTGRTRTLTLTGSLIGSASITSVEDLPGYPGPHPNYEASTAVSGSIEIQAFQDDLGASWATITIEGTNSYPGRGISGPTVLLPQSSDIEIVTATGLGDSDTGSQTSSRTTLGTTSVGGSGSFSISVGTEEYFEEVTPFSVNAHGFPSYGGTAYADGPMGRGVRFREQMKVGETLTVTATLGSATATSSNVIASAVPVTDYRVRIDSTASVEGSGQNATWGATGVTFGSGNLGIADYLYSGIEGYVDCTSGVKVHATETGTADIRTSSATGQLYPQISYHLYGPVCTMESPDYPGSIVLTWLQKNSGVSDSQRDITSTGAVDEIVTQKRYSASGFYGLTTTPVASLNEQSYVQAWFKGSSLSANQEDSRNWRILAHGKAYDSFTITHGTYTVDNGGSTSGWTASDGAVTFSTSGGELTIDATGSEASGDFTATKTFTGYSWEYHRYLKIKIKSVLNGSDSFTVTIGTKVWDKDRDGNSLATGSADSYVERYIDLCCPTSTSSTTDGQYTRWPETASGSGRSATEGELWGINWPTSIVLGGLTVGERYKIDELVLARNSFAAYSITEGFLNWQDAYPDSGSTHTEFLPHFVLDADGRYSDRGYYLTNVETSGTPSYSEVSLTSLISVLNSSTGITATAVGSFPADGYHTNSRPCSWVGGGGYQIETSTDPEYTCIMDVSMVSATVKAQALWDSLEGYPGIGDPFTGSAFPSAGDSETLKALPQRIAPVLHGQAVGICHKTSTAPLVGATVKAYSSSEIAGTGISDSQGYYQTGIPYGKGNTSRETELQQPPLPYLNETHTWLDRLRVRTSFRRDASTVNAPSRDTQSDKRHFRVMVS